MTSVNLPVEEKTQKVITSSSSNTNTKFIQSNENITSTVADYIEHDWKTDLKSIILSKEQIASKISTLGKQITTDYRDIISTDEPLLVICLLRGAFMFFSDLVREIHVKHFIDFLMIKSYDGTNATEVKVILDLNLDPANKHILIVEDLIDTGSTLLWLKKHLQSRNIKSIRFCCLLSKRTNRRRSDFNLKIDYLGFECNDEFIVGYGMDFNHEYRSLSSVACLKPHIFSKC